MLVRCKMVCSDDTGYFARKVTISFHVHDPTVSLASRPDRRRARRGLGAHVRTQGAHVARRRDTRARSPTSAPQVPLSQRRARKSTHSTGSRALVPTSTTSRCPPRAASAQRYFHPTGSRAHAPTSTPLGAHPRQRARTSTHPTGILAFGPTVTHPCAHGGQGGSLVPPHTRGSVSLAHIHVPAQSGKFASRRVLRAVVLPCPLQNLQEVPALSGVYTLWCMTSVETRRVQGMQHGCPHAPPHRAVGQHAARGLARDAGEATRVPAQGRAWQTSLATS